MGNREPGIDQNPVAPSLTLAIYAETKPTLGQARSCTAPPYSPFSIPQSPFPAFNAPTPATATATR